MIIGPLKEALRPEWLTVIVTTAYTIVAWLQWRAIKRQAHLLQRQINEAKEFSDASSRTAADTLAAIQEQARQMAKQNETMEQQASDARTSSSQATAIAKQSADAALLNADALIGVERAWLIIVMEGGPSDFTSARFHLANVGATPAWVIEIECMFWKSSKPVSSTAGFTLHGLKWESGSILPGQKESKSITEPIAGRVGVSPADLQSAAADGLYLIFIGRVKYQDVFGQTRETATCQRFVPELGWVLHGPSDLNRRT